MRDVSVFFYFSIVFFILVSYKQIFLNTFLHYDEVGNYLPAWNYVDYGKYAFTVQSPDTFNSTSPFITIGAYVGYSLVLFCSYLGSEWHIARLYTYLHTVLLLCFVYLLVKKYFNKKIALLACTVLMLNSIFITYSTRIMGEIPALMGCFLGFWAYLHGKEKKQFWWYTLAFAGFQISILSKEYFAILIGLTLFFTWIFQDKCRFSPAFWLGLTLPLVIIMWYFFHFQDIHLIQTYFKERQIYRIEFFAWKLDALQWLIFKPLIWIGYILHSIKCYIQKRHTDIFLWIFQTLYLFLFLVSIGFERFGIGLCIISSIYTAEFLYGLYSIPAITKVQRVMIYSLFVVLLIQKSPYLLWKNPEKKPVLPLQNYENKVLHTPELSLIPLIVKNSYQIPLYPPAKFKPKNYDNNAVHIIQSQYMKADVLILGEYARTEYPNVYNKQIIEKHFEKSYIDKHYEIWVKKFINTTL